MDFSSRHDAEQLVRAWLRKTEIAPEDDETPLPSDFPEHVMFMETSPEEALKEYLEKYRSRLGEDVKDDPEVKEIMEGLGSKVYVPQSWEGIKGIVFHINWKEGMPVHLKPKARPISPRLYSYVKQEFERLTKYMYVPSQSPIASPLVVAPKDSAPYIRLCGDYRDVNRYIDGSHFPIPDIKKLISRLQGKKYYIDIDLTNAFHQIRLDEESSSKLSIQTPWAQIRPLFLPEGCKPASHQLQRTVTDLFRDIEDDALIAHDNLLIMADDIQHAKDLLRKVLQICADKNVILKLSKSNLIVTAVDFFGYRVTTGGVGIMEAKRAGIDAIPFPTNIKQARSFIGKTVYYSGFMPGYADLMAPLHRMLTKGYDWTNAELEQEQRGHFAAYKEGLAQAMLLIYPDYSLPWTLRTDASSYGIGGVLFQTRQMEDGTLRHEPLFFVSKKFSDAATRWSTIEQESFAIFHCLKELEFYLWGKPIVVETDHANLVWMEHSVIPKIVRWRLYIQTFSLMIKHLPGRHNHTADYFSRMHAPPDKEHLLSFLDVLPNTQAQVLHKEWVEDEVSEWIDTLNLVNALEQCAMPAEVVPEPEEAAAEPPAADAATPKMSDKEMLDSIHNARQGHMGARRTWIKLKNVFPGHKIPYAFVEDYVATCPLCQKHRLGRGDAYYTPKTKGIPANALHSCIGIDHLTMKKDEKGNVYALVIVNQFSKLTQIYAVPRKDAITTAKCLLDYYSRYGLVEQLRCDQGSDYTGEVIEELHKYLGIPMQFALIRRHESSGVERTHREIRRHITALVAEESLYGSWSDETILAAVQYVINSSENLETGKTPFELHFGTYAAKYHTLPESLDKITSEEVSEYLTAFDSHLNTLRKQAKEFRERVQGERQDAPEKIYGSYQPGDLILYDNRLLAMRSKVTDALWAGPFTVVSQVGNDITCVHSNMGTDHVLHAADVKLFIGSQAAAERVARFDKQQLGITAVLGHKGRHHGQAKERLSFEVQWEDGKVSWEPYSQDLQPNEAFQRYCASRKYLTYLNTLGPADEYIDSLRALGIPARIQPGVKAWADLRFYEFYHFGVTYDDLALPGHLRQPHVVEIVFRVLEGAGRVKATIEFEIPLFNKGRHTERYNCPPDFFHQYIYEELPVDAVVVDAAYAARHPIILTPPAKVAEPQPDLVVQPKGKARAKRQVERRAVGVLGVGDNKKRVTFFGRDVIPNCLQRAARLEYIEATQDSLVEDPEFEIFLAASTAFEADSGEQGWNRNLAEETQAWEPVPQTRIEEVRKNFEALYG